MIRIQRNGAKLFVGIDLASVPGLTEEERKANAIFWFEATAASVLTATLLRENLADALGDRLVEIRRHAYEQGAKDRARKATHFSRSLETSVHHKGCFR
jgi:hypothetical protein